MIIYSENVSFFYYQDNFFIIFICFLFNFYFFNFKFSHLILTNIMPLYFNVFLLSDFFHSFTFIFLSIFIYSDSLRLFAFLNLSFYYEKKFSFFINLKY